MPSPRVLLLALDSAEPTLIRRWTAEGRLPNLAGLMQSGASADLRSAAEEFPDEVERARDGGVTGTPSSSTASGISGP